MAQDSISLEISADASNASQALDGLIRRLSTLNRQLSNIDTKGIQKFSSGLNMMSSAMHNMKDIKMPDFTRTVKGIKQFENIDGSKLSTVTSQLQPLADAINALNNTQFDNKNVTSFINALAKLSSANVGSLNMVQMQQVGDSIRTLQTALQGAPEVSKNTIQFVNAIAQLSKSAQYIPIVTSSLPNLSSALLNFINSMQSVGQINSSVVDFTSAIGYLASAGDRAQTTAGGLGVLAVQLKNLFNVMATAPVISQSTIQMTQALAQLASQGSKVNSACNLITRGFANLRNGSARTQKSLKSLAYQFGKFYANFWLLIRAFKKIGEAIDISSQLTEVQNVVDVTFGSMTNKVEEFAKTSIQDLGMSELSLKQYASRFQAMGNAMGITSESIAEANEFLNARTYNEALGKSYIDLGDSMADVSLNLTRLTADMASFYDVEQSDVAEDLEAIFTGMTRPLRTYGLDLTQATLKEWALKNGLDADIASMTQAQKMMLRYQYVLANTTNAQADFIRTQGSWANQVRILKQQLQQLAIIVGRTLVNALKPLLTALNLAINKLIQFAKVVSDTLGAIFGWTYEVGSTGTGITDVTSDIDDLADGLGSASDKAKELSKQLQGFDEINNITLNDKSDGSGGSGSGASAGGGGSDSSGEWKRSERLFKSLKDLEDLGEYIGDKITNALKSIDWDKVYSGAKNFGKGLADFLNGLISPELFGEVGSTIAKSLNTAIYASIAFTDNFRFDEAGEAVAESINRFFEDFDFTALADAINGWLDGIKEFIKSLISNVKWGEVIEGIKDFLAELDWGDVALFIGAITLFKGVGFTVELAKGVASALRSEIIAKIVTSLGGSSVLAGISVGIKVAVILLLSYEVGKFLGTKLADLVIPKIMEANGYDSSEYKIDTDCISIKEIVKYTFDYVLFPNEEAKKQKNLLSDYVDVWIDTWNTFEPIKKIAKKITDAYINADRIDILSLIFAPFSEGIKKLLEALGIGTEKINEWGDGAGHTFADTSAKASEELSKIPTSMDDMNQNVREKLETMRSTTETTTSDMKTKIVGSMTEASSGLSAKSSEMSKNWDDATSKIKTRTNTEFSDTRKKITEETEKMKTQTSNSVTSMNKRWDTISHIKTQSDSVFKSAYTIITGWIEKMKSALNFEWKLPDLKVPHISVTGGVAPYGIGGMGSLPVFDVQWYANGGFPDADLFFANENGIPELVGTMGGKPAVASGQEITGISDAVYSTSQAELQLLRRQNQLLEGILEKDLSISAGSIYRSVIRSDREYAMRTGNSAFAY